MSTGHSQELALLDQASRLLAEANSLEEITSFHDKVAFVQLCIKEAKLGLTLLNQAAEAKLRAERKAGILLHSMHLRGGDRRSKGHAVPLKLENLGVSHQESKRWQQVASVPYHEFLDYFRIANQLGQEATRAGLLRAAKESRGPRCSKPLDRQQRATTAVIECDSALLDELLEEHANHCQLLDSILRPFYEEREQALQRCEKRFLGQLIREMIEQISQLSIILRKPVTFGRDGCGSVVSKTCAAGYAERALAPPMGSPRPG